MQKDPHVQEYLRARHGGGAPGEADRIPGAATAAKAQQAAQEGLLGDLEGLSALGFQTRRLRAVS